MSGTSYLSFQKTNNKQHTLFLFWDMYNALDRRFDQEHLDGETYEQIDNQSGIRFVICLSN